MFQKHICPLGAKFKITTNMYKEVKGSKDIEQTTHWARKSGLILTFEHVT